MPIRDMYNRADETAQQGYTNTKSDELTLIPESTLCKERTNS